MVIEGKKDFIWCERQREEIVWRLDLGMVCGMGVSIDNLS